MSDVVGVLISTLVLAASYGLVAIGISLVWSSLGMLNLAHGITFAIAGYGAWLAGTEISSSPFVVLAGGMLAGAATAVLVAGVAFLPLKRQENFGFRSLTITLAMNIVGSQLLLQVFGPNSRDIPDIFTFEPITIAGTVILAERVGAIVVSAVVLTAVLIWFRASRAGLRVRALMQNPEGAALVGVGVNQTALAVMAISGMLAGLAAVLLQSVFYASPTGWGTPLTKGLVISLLGGLGSVPGAIAGAVILGAAEATTARFIGGQYVLYVQFAIVIGVLLVRPRGIAGLLDEVREADE